MTFYTKPDCGLCRKAEAVLDDVVQQIAFNRVTVDISMDDEAFRKYAVDIPVVLIDGVEHARHAVDARAFFRALKAI